MFIADSSEPVVCFLDETGLVAQDRYFAVGVLSVPEASDLQLAIQKHRQRFHWRNEWHFSEMTKAGRPVFDGLLDHLDVNTEWRFHLSLADREAFDVVKACGDRFHAYERVAAHCLSFCVVPGSQATVIADEYVTPDRVRLERQIRRVVNRNIGSDSISAIVRVRSNAHDPLQIADVLTGATVYPLRHRSNSQRPSPKFRFAQRLRERLGPRIIVSEFDPGWLWM